jgi:hypothetical protein
MWKVLFTVALLSLPAPAQLWRKSRVEVKAGEGAGPIVLGQPLSKSALKYLGKSAQQGASASEAGSGYVVFGAGDNRDLRKGFLLTLNDGVKPDHVHTIQVKGIRASTREGIYLDGPANLIAKKYPEAQQDINPFSRNPEFCLPGLIIRTKAGKVDEFVVESKDSQRWRFRQLAVVPGVRVGPFEIGKAVGPEALEQLGPPTLEVKSGKTQGSGLLRWAVAGQRPERMIEVVLHNGKNPRAVVSVRIRGIRAQTNQKVKMGDSAEAVKDLYPDGREGLSESTGGVLWRVAGANFSLKDGILKEIYVFELPPNNNRGR